MDNTPKTRSESKKNQKQKGRPNKLGSSKHVRAYEKLLEQQNIHCAKNSKNKK